MAWHSRRSHYDRARILAQARRAALRRAHAKAAALYDRVRKAEPGNIDLLRKLAIQRARAGQHEEAWRDYRTVAAKLFDDGFIEQAIGTLREFAHHVPQQPGVWLRIAEFELKRERRPDAVAALVEGRRNFRARRHHLEAIALLRRAREIDPTHFGASFDLAGLLARSGAVVPARRILETLVPHAEGRRERRRLRGRLFRLSPTIANAWSWLLAAIGSTPPPPPPRPQRA